MDKKHLFGRMENGRTGDPIGESTEPKVGMKVVGVSGPGHSLHNPGWVGTVVDKQVDRWGTHWIVKKGNGEMTSFDRLMSGPGIGVHQAPSGEIMPYEESCKPERTGEITECRLVEGLDDPLGEKCSHQGRTEKGQFDAADGTGQVMADSEDEPGFAFMKDKGGAARVKGAMDEASHKAMARGHQMGISALLRGASKPADDPEVDHKRLNKSAGKMNFLKGYTNGLNKAKIARGDFDKAGWSDADKKKFARQAQKAKDEYNRDKAGKFAKNEAVVATIKASDPRDAALRFSSVLAVDKGVQSKIVRVSDDEYKVVADDGKEIRVVKESRKVIESNEHEWISHRTGSSALTVLRYKGKLYGFVEKMPDSRTDHNPFKVMVYKMLDNPSGGVDMKNAIYVKGRDGRVQAQKELLALARRDWAAHRFTEADDRAAEIKKLQAELSAVGGDLSAEGRAAKEKRIRELRKGMWNEANVDQKTATKSGDEFDLSKGVKSKRPGHSSAIKQGMNQRKRSADKLALKRGEWDESENDGLEDADGAQDPDDLGTPTDEGRDMQKKKVSESAETRQRKYLFGALDNNSRPIEESMFAIEPGGLRRLGGAKVTILPNREYYLGASSSPDHIIVTRVDKDTIYYKAHPYKTETRIQMDIGKDLIVKGSETWLKGPYPQYQRELASSLKDLLSGGTGKQIDPKDFERVLVRVRPTEAPKSKSRADDPWYAAEEYGGVGGYDHKDSPTGMDYDISTSRGSLKKIKSDKRFTVVSVRND